MISLPLTDAGDGDPSCIYVLPAGTDPFRPGPIDRPPPDRGWRAPRSSPAHLPRISVAACVQSSDVAPVDRFEIGPRFETRLAAIGRAILRHRDAGAGTETGVSSALLAACRRWWKSASDATACPAGV